MAARKKTAARRNPVNTVKLCIRIISIGDNQLVTISDLPQPVRLEGTGRSSPRFRRHPLIRRAIGKSSLQSFPCSRPIGDGGKDNVPSTLVANNWIANKLSLSEIV
jgi:hypothetical protein